MSTNSYDSILVSLREIRDSDLESFFAHQMDEEADYMAAFTKKDPTDRVAFDEHWRRIRNDKKIILRTIPVNGAVAGNIAQFEMFGEPEVGYWIGKEFWGQGVATSALRRFLEIVTVRPLFARAAVDNIASIRVLEKNGFRQTGKEKGFANARGKEIEELLFRLN